MKLDRFTAPLWDLACPYYFNDFNNLATGADGLTTLVADAGTSVAAGDARAGIAVITTGATDNNEAMVRTTNELWIFRTDTPSLGRTSLQFTEAATDDANVFFGFASAAGANLLVDDGAGVRTSGCIACLYKVDGGTVWRCHSRNGATANDTASTTTAGGAAYQDLEVEFHEGDGTNVTVVYRVNGSLLKDSNGFPIRHQVPIASATEMHLAVYAKAGGANSEVVNVDFIYGHQRR
jgi:hypothetical protein